MKQTFFKVLNGVEVFLSTARGKIIASAAAICIIGSAVVIACISVSANTPVKPAVASTTGSSDTTSYYVPPIESSSAASSSAVSSAPSSAAVSSASSQATVSTPSQTLQTQPAQTQNQTQQTTPQAPANNPTPPTNDPTPTTGSNLAGLASYGEYSYRCGVEETNAQFKANEPSFNCTKIASDLKAYFQNNGYTFDTDSGNVFRDGEGGGIIRGKLTGGGHVKIMDVFWQYNGSTYEGVQRLSWTCATIS